MTLKKMNRKSNLKKPVVFLLAFCLAAGGLSGCGKSEAEKMDSKVLVDIETAAPGTLSVRTDYIGSVEPGQSVDVTPLVSGTVKKVNVKVGDKVKAGDVLCKFDDTSADLSVKSAEDAVNTAKAGKSSAQDQQAAAKAQSKSSINTLKATLKSYEEALDKSRKQLKKMKSAKKKVIKAAKKAQKAYADAKTMYKTAQALYINYQSFLEANPDCRTSVGLNNAASGFNLEDVEVEIPDVDVTDPDSDEGDSTQAEETTQAPVDKTKQKTAQALLKSLSKAGLTVEYLSETGLEALKENVSDAESAYNAASGGTSQLDGTIASLESSIEQLKSQIKSTRASLKSAKDVANASSIGSEVYDAQIDAAETGVEAAEYQKDMYTIKAPISGIIDAVNVTENEMGAQGYAAFTISESETMLATFYVTEEVKNYVRIGDIVNLKKADGTVDTDTEGAITNIGTVVDPQKGLFKITALIVPSDRKALSGGTSVTFSIISNAAKNQILIPFDAVYYEDGQAYVYIVDEDNIARRTDVTTGLYNEDQIAVLSGIQVGDRVVTSWASGLKDGAQVEEPSKAEEQSTEK